MDACIEEFVDEVRKAKEGGLPVILGEKTNVKFQGHVNSEHQTSISDSNGDDLINKWNNNAASHEEVLDLENHSKALVIQLMNFSIMEKTP